jgi:putative ABC transport system substrate-binding protein
VRAVAPASGRFAPGAPGTVHGLRDLGYVEGQNVVIERRSAEGKPERLPTLAAELVRLNVDVILASGERTIPVLLAATNTIPTVHATVASLFHSA